MKKEFLKNLAFLLTFGCCCLLLASCNNDDEYEEEEDTSADVGKSAHPVIVEAGSFHIFSLKEFYQAADVDDDIMVLVFDDFTPSATTEDPDEDDEDADQTANYLGWTQEYWQEETLSWGTNQLPKQDSAYQKSREYRVLTDNQLKAPTTVINEPIYETIDDDIFERQLAATFVWDMASYGIFDSEHEVDRDDIADYENFYSFSILPHASIWAEDAEFSEGAIIYGASRSVNEEVIVVESVFGDDSKFSLDDTEFAQGATSLKAALEQYSSDTKRLEYQYTLDYKEHYSIYLSFETSNFDSTGSGTAKVSRSSGSETHDVSYTVHYDEAHNPIYIEIDTASLSSGIRDLLGNLPAYFNPVILGPFSKNGSQLSETDVKRYYYGKRYIRTDEDNRIHLKPVIFLNETAKNDIKTAFSNWRIERHDEEN